MQKLQASDLKKTYRGRRVVDNVSLEVRQGEVVGLLGPNGAGKTTTFNILVGLIRPDYGRVQLDDEDITDLSRFARCRYDFAILVPGVEKHHRRRGVVIPKVVRHFLVPPGKLARLGVDGDDRVRFPDLLQGMGLCAKERWETQ